MAKTASDVGSIAPSSTKRVGFANTKNLVKVGKAKKNGKAIKVDQEFTKLLADHMLNAKSFYEYGLAHGLTTPDDLELTVNAKRELARFLVDNGVSQRAAAEALDVHHSTVQFYLADKSAKNGGSSARERTAQSNQNDWRTPRKYLDAAREVMGGIDLDPATSKEANKTVKATKFYTEADNGLEKPMKGTVWCNPPYGGQARLFVERVIREYQVGNVTQACILTNSAGTETKWFQALFDYPVCFVSGRMDFGGPSRDVSSQNTHGSAITYLGPNVDKFVKEFSGFGAVMKKVKP